MGFMFVELNSLSPSGRLEQYTNDPQSLEEILLYYLCPICPAEIYSELGSVVLTIKVRKVSEKMWSLFVGASAIRRNDSHYEYDPVENVLLVNTYEVKPPTDRLGALYDDNKLDNVLSGMGIGGEAVNLPPMKLRQLPSGGEFRYSVIDGIHRYYASVKLGYGKLPALIV